MENWIINDFGGLFRSGTAELTSSLGYTQGGPAIENYAIENMGHVGIAVRGGKVHVRFRPSLLPEVTVSSLLHWLFEHRESQVVLSWLDEVWHMERPMHGALAITHFCHLLDKRTLPRAAAAPRGGP